jgi:hypothetical protein
MHYIRFKVLTAVAMNIIVFWDVTRCNLAGSFEHFRGTYYPHLQSRRVDASFSEDQGSRHVPLKCWHLSTKLHYITPQKVILRKCHTVKNQYKGKGKVHPRTLRRGVEV